MRRDDLQAQRILVTHVRGFLGLPAARACAAAGAHVLCHDPSFVDAAARAAFKRDEPNLMPIAGQTPAALASECGPLSCLIANHDHPAIRAPFAPAATDELQAALQALCVEPFALAAALVEGMRVRGGGKLIFVTSAAPLRGLAHYAPYVTARGAANALARTLAIELAPANVKVLAFAPNFVASPTYFPDELLADPAQRARIEAHIPLGRLATAEEAGTALAFLASPAADFFTGSTLPYSGGWA
ncbi:MAG: SDR family oxidoreductase [Geminicoccaceae bacterium]|nr:MAG: SDR family oxidoreductase [Geminicoccaceae bacterium]